MLQNSKQNIKGTYREGKRYTDEKFTVLSPNPIVRWYSKTKFKIAIKLAKPNIDDKILDFGCGGGYLKRTNPQYDITGYDIIKEQSDIQDYTSLSPTKIFALDVLEHISKNDIENIIYNFKKMNNKFELIVAIPTENWVSRKSRLLLGKPERVWDHITKLEEILNILNKHLILIQKVNFLTVTLLAKYKYSNIK